MLELKDVEFLKHAQTNVMLSDFHYNTKLTYFPSKEVFIRETGVYPYEIKREDAYFALELVLRVLSKKGYKLILEGNDSYDTNNNPYSLSFKIFTNLTGIASWVRLDVDECSNIDNKSRFNSSKTIFDDNKTSKKHSFTYTSLHDTLACRDYNIMYTADNLDLAKEIASLFSDLELTRKRDTIREESYISMITLNMMGQLAIKDLRMDWHYKKEDLSLHYGDKFAAFHDKLIPAISNTSKGIVLFHGIPGTGKTHYIRRITNSLNKAGKKVVIIPQAVFELIGTPAFTDFMLNTFIGQKKGIVFVMEDAEQLLKKREGNSDADKVSNLLNLGDGLMNDLFHIQVIATFNTDLDNIDPAVLRAGRLIARHEFGRLLKDEAIRLATSLKVSQEKIDTIVEPTSLAEVFALTHEELVA